MIVKSFQVSSCTATKLNGQPCKRLALTGKTVCGYHDGKFNRRAPDGALVDMVTVRIRRDELKAIIELVEGELGEYPNRYTELEREGCSTLRKARDR